MEIIFDQTCFQLAVMIFAGLFFLTAKKDLLFSVAVIPLILPFYLIKIYFYPLIWLKGLQQAVYGDFTLAGKTILNSLFALPERNSTSLKPDFEQIGQFFVPTNLLEILLIILLFFGLKNIFIQLKKIYQEKSKNPLFIIVFGFFLASFLSLPWAINRANSLGVVKGWIVIPILIFLLVSNLIKKEKFKKLLYKNFLMGGIFMVISSLIFLASNVLSYDDRLTGIFLSPNHLAMSLLPALTLFLVTLPRVRHNKTTHALLLLMIFLTLLALYRTYSYSSWLALGGVSLAYSMFYLAKTGKERSKKMVVPLLLFFIFSFSLLFFSQLNNPKLQSILQGEYYSSLNSRLMIWKSAILIARDHWLFGIGGGNFQIAYLDYQKYFSEPYEEWAVPEPHNIFLAFYLGLGLTGLISFFGLMIFISADSIKKIRIAKSNLKNLTVNNSLYLWSIFYLISVLIVGLIDTPYWKNDLALLFWLTVATNLRLSPR